MSQSCGFVSGGCLIQIFFKKTEGLLDPVRYSLFYRSYVNVANCCVGKGFLLTFSRIVFGIYWTPKVFWLGAMASYTYEEYVKLISDIRISVCYKISLGFSQKFSDK